MEVIVYKGPDLSVEEMETLAPKLSADGFELKVCPCMSKEHLRRELARLANQETEQKSSYFRFRPAGGGIRLIKLSRIYYFHGYGHRINVVLEDGQELEGRTLRTATCKLLDPLAESGQFLRIFRSCYVNMVHVTSINPTQVKLDNGVILKISHKFYRAFMES